VIDISNPTNPNLIYTCDTPDFANGVAVSGYFAFVADGNAGLQVFHLLLLPFYTEPIGTYDTPGEALGVTV
jgi:hypothetical protein